MIHLNRSTEHHSGPQFLLPSSRYVRQVAIRSESLPVAWNQELHDAIALFVLGMHHAPRDCFVMNADSLLLVGVISTNIS